MPNLGVFHPQVVHFAIALCIVGVGLRVLSLLRPQSWLSPAARALIVLAALAAYVSVKSGTDAHGPVERVPGAREAVVEHEEWGERARNILLALAAIELVGLALAENRRKLLNFASVAVGAAALFAIYETGEHGGELVYSYAGGVGIRSGEPEDVKRLLLAGLYQQAMLDRREKRPEAAAALFSEMATRYPDNTSVQTLAVESLLRDRNDPAAARTALDALKLPEGDARVARSMAMLKADIFAAAGQKDSARAILEDLMKQMPGNPRLRAKLDSLK